MFKRNPVARVDYLAELGKELEVLSLAAIMMIEESIMNASSGAAAGGGSA